MRRNIFVIALVLCIIIPANVALAGGIGGFFNGLGKSIQYYAKQKAWESQRQQKEEERRQKQWDNAVKKQQRDWEKDMYEKEIGKITQKDPLDREWLQKIDVYKEILDSSKNEQTIKKIIKHIEIYGVDRYGENLSQKHRELLEELIIVKDRIEKAKAKKEGGKAGEKAVGLVIMGGIAYILRVVIFKIPL